MKSAKVSELKARLSAYLRVVREEGETVEVLDRRTPVARLVPVDEDGRRLRVRPAELASDSLRGMKPVRLKRSIDVQRLLGESREDRS